MGKRIMNVIAAFLVAAVVGTAGTAYAANMSKPYIAEQAIGKAPDMKVYLTGSKMSETAAIAGTMGDISFTQDGETVVFEKSGEAIDYIILLDNSGSVNEEQFLETKEQLKKLRRSLKEGDEMTLYTVGTFSSEGEKTQVISRTVGKNDKKEKKSDSGKIDDIEYMKGIESKTVLYRSINQVLKEQASPKKRTVLLLITDGEDDSQGKDIDNVSTAETVKEAAVPVYGILLNRKPSKAGTTETQDANVSYTRNQILSEKNSRGYYHDCSVDATAESVQQAFDVIGTILQKETYVANLKAPTNRTAGRSELELTVDNTAVDAVSVDYSDYEKDDEAPNIVGNVEEVGSASIQFSIQDKNGINLSDVNEPSNYMVQSASENEDGKVWAIESVNAVSNGNEVSVTLTFTEEFFNDHYVLHCSNIRDTSQDENKMETAAEFSIENGLDARSVAIKEGVRSYWWIGLVLLVLIIGISIIIVVHRKKSETGVSPDELEKADSRKIRLTITDRAGMIKDVEWNVEGSLFVGRSDICNIYFDDDRLSKQHFVVEVNKMGCYIEDLESTNGTYVNGVKIGSRRMLLDGDVITAGREKFVFHMPKRELGEEGR